MLGFHISVYQQTDKGTSPATLTSPKGKRLAEWETGLSGLDWIDELVKDGKAIDLGVFGLLGGYTATAEHLIPRIVEHPPGALEWQWRTGVDRAALADCRPDEWLLVEAWDLG